MRGHENQIAVVFIGGIDNRFGRREGFESHNFAINVFFLNQFASDFQSFLSHFFNSGIVLINTFRSVLREIGIAVRLNNGNDDNRGTQSLGKIGRGFQRFIREFGSVCRNQNTVIHS